MSSVAVHHSSPAEVVRDALARVDAGLDDALAGLQAMAASRPPSGASREWRDALQALERLARRVDAGRLRAIAGAEAASVPEAGGFVDTSAWVSRHTQVNRPRAASEAIVAGALGDGPALVLLPEGSGSDGGERRGRTPAGVALDAGAISGEHARVIVSALDDLPSTVTSSQRIACETELVRLAATRTPAQLAKAARRVLAATEPREAVVDAHENALVAAEEDAARERSAFWIKDNRDGTMTGHFTVPWFAGATLKKVIDAMTAPRRSHPSAAREDSGDEAAEVGTDGAAWRSGQLDWQQRRGLAFADLLGRIPTDHLHPKTAATVLVTVTLDALRGKVEQVAGTDVGDSVSAGQARRTACEAGVVPAVMGGTSLPLDLGRQRRLHSEGQRVALALMYDECAADGCDRPLAWTETHHLVAWRDDGHTRLDEAVPLCGTHHHMIDRTDTDHRVERHSAGHVTIHFRRRAEGP